MNVQRRRAWDNIFLPRLERPPSLLQHCVQNVEFSNFFLEKIESEVALFFVLLLCMYCNSIFFTFDLCYARCYAQYAHFYNIYAHSQNS